MHDHESHGRLAGGQDQSRWRGQWARLGMGILALCALWLGYQLWTAHQEQLSWARSQETSSVARSLHNRLQERINSFRNQALRLGDLQRQSRFKELPEQGPRGLLFWGEWGFQNRELSLWAESPALGEVQRDWIRQLQARVPWDALREGTTATSAMIRGESAEWLAFFFRNGNALHGLLLDPAQAFAISLQGMQLLTGPSAAEHAWRAYVIADDGRVLSHSQSAFNGADFSGSEVYRKALAGALRGGRPGGVGKYRGVDDVAVTAAYSRMAPYGLAVAVELNESQPVASAAVAPTVRAIQGRAVGQVLVALLLAAAGGAVVWLRRRQRLDRQRAAEAVYFENQLEQFDRDTIEEAPAEEVPAPPVLNPALAGDTLMLSEIRPDDRTVHRAGSGRQPASADEQIDSQIVENALYQELQADPGRSREEQKRRVALAKLEGELVELAEFLDDEQIARIFVERVTSFMSGLVAAPALYFRTHRESGQAILESVEGLDPMDADIVAGGMAFPLVPELVGRAQGTALRGSIFPMTDYPPLANLLRLRFAGAPYQAWAIQCTARGARNGEIYGVLVIVADGERIRGESEAIARVIRSTGQYYDHAATLNTRQ